MSRLADRTEHPDWERLVARRDAAGRDPSGWHEAVAHMDGCEACRRAALAADPTLVFRRLPAPAVDAADADAMRRAVASLRRANRVSPVDAAAGVGESSLSDRLRRLPAALRHLAATLLLVAAGTGALLLAGVDLPDGGGHAVPTAAETRPAVPGTGADGLWRHGAPQRPADAPQQQVFEGLSAPRAADVYQTGEGDMTVVMVVDETLDI